MINAQLDQNTKTSSIWCNDNGAMRYQSMVRAHGWNDFIFDLEARDAIVAACRSHDPDDVAGVDEEIERSAARRAENHENHLFNTMELDRQRRNLYMIPRLAQHRIQKEEEPIREMSLSARSLDPFYIQKHKERLRELGLEEDNEEESENEEEFDEHY